MQHNGDVVDRVSVEFLVGARPPPWPTPLALRPGRPARSGRSCMTALSGWALKLYSPLAVTIVMLICLGSSTRPLVPQILDNLQSLALWCVAGINLLTGYVCMRLHMSASMDVAGYSGGGSGASGSGSQGGGSGAGSSKTGAAFAAAKTLAVLGPPAGQPGSSSESSPEDAAVLDPRTGFLPHYRATAELQMGPVFARRVPPAAGASGAAAAAVVKLPLGAAAASARDGSAAAPTVAPAQEDAVLFIEEGASDLRVLPPIVLQDGTVLPPTVLGQPPAVGTGAAAAEASAAGGAGPLQGFDYYTETRHGWMVRGLLALVPTDLDCFASCSKRRCWKWRGCRSCGRLSWKRGWLYACPCTRACCTDEGCTASEGKTASMQTLVMASTAALVVSGIFLPFVAARALPVCTEHAGSLALLLFPGGTALLLGTTSLMGFGRKLRDPPAISGPGQDGAGSGRGGDGGSAAATAIEEDAGAGPLAAGETAAAPTPAAKESSGGAAAGAASAAAALFMTAWRGAVRTAVLAELPLRLVWVRLLVHRSATLLALFALLTVPIFAGALEMSPIPGLDGSTKPTAGLDVGRSTGVLLAVMVVPLAVGAGLARAGAIPPGSSTSAARVCQSVPVRGTGLAAYLSRVSSLLFSFTRLVPVPLTQPIDVAGFYDVVRHPSTRAAFTGVPGCPGANPPAAVPRTGLARLLLGPGGEAAPRALSSYPLLAICCVAVLSPAQWRHRIRFLLPASFRSAVRRALCGVPSGVTPAEEPNLYMAWWAWLTRVFNVESTLNAASEVLTWLALAMVLGNAPAAARASVLAPDFTAPTTPELGACPTGITWAMRVPIYQYAAVSCVLLGYITAMTCWMLLGVARPPRVAPGSAAAKALAPGASSAAAGAGKAAGAASQLVASPGGVQEAVSAVSLQSAIVFALTLPRKSLAAGLCLAWCLLSKNLGGDAADSAAGDALYRFRVQIATAYGVYHVISSLYIVALQWLIHNTLLRQRYSYLRRGVERGTAAKLAAARAGLAAGFTAAVRAKVAERALSRLKQHRSSIASVATTSRSITSRLTLGDTQRTQVLAVASAAAERLPREAGGTSSRGGGFAMDRDGLASDGSDGEAFHAASARSFSSASSALGGLAADTEGLPKPEGAASARPGATRGLNDKTSNVNNSSAKSLLGNASATAAAAAAAASLSSALASRPASVRLSLPKLAPLAALPAAPPATAEAAAGSAPATAAPQGGQALEVAAPTASLPAPVAAAALAAQAALPAVLAAGTPAALELLKLKEAASALTSYVEMLSATLPAAAGAAAAPSAGAAAAASVEAAARPVGGATPNMAVGTMGLDRLPQPSLAPSLTGPHLPAGLPPPPASAPPVLSSAAPTAAGPFLQAPAATFTNHANGRDMSAPQMSVTSENSFVFAGAAAHDSPLWPEQPAWSAPETETAGAAEGSFAWPSGPVPQQIRVSEPLAASSPGRFLADMSVPVPIKVETPATRSRKQPKSTHTLSGASTTGRPAAASSAYAQTLAALSRLQGMAAAAGAGPAGAAPGHVLPPRQGPLSTVPPGAATAQVPPVMRATVSLSGQPAPRAAAGGALQAAPGAGHSSNPYAYRPASGPASSGAAGGGFSNPFGPSSSGPSVASARGGADDAAVRQSLEHTMAIIAASRSPGAASGRTRKAATVKATDLVTPVVPSHVESSIVRGSADGLGLRSDIAATFQQVGAASVTATGGLGSSNTGAGPALARTAPAPVHRSIAGDLFLRREGATPGHGATKPRQSEGGEAALYRQYLPKTEPQKVSDNSNLLVGTSLGGPGRRGSAESSGASHEVAVPAVPSRAALHPAPKAAFSASAKGASGMY